MLRSESLRQLLIISSLILCSISDGFIFGQMSGMVDDLRGKESQITLNDADVSLIASIINATCIMGFGVVALLSEKFGRRQTISILSIPVLVSYIMVYLGQDMATIVTSRVIVGVCYGGVLILTYIAMAEYMNPNKRAFYINLISAIGPSVGTVLGHVLCLLLHWRTVALIGLIPTGLSAILPLFWVESPSWLASQGRFEECKKVYRELFGKSNASEAQLELLIETEKAKRNEITGNKRSFAIIVEKMRTAMTKKYFWKIMVLGAVINIYRIAAGKLMFSTLAITMLQELTGTSNILVYTFYVDGFFILGSIFSLFSLSAMKMRPLIFSLGFLANFTLLVLSACVHFIPSDSTYYVWTVISLLAFYFITVLTGPYAVLEPYLAEIFPLDIKLYCILLSSFLISIASFLAVFLAPLMFATIGYDGVFLLNALIVFLCLGYLWFFMPETKGRTLQEIEYYFKNNNFNDLQETNNEQVTGLL
ncbi:sugar transporter ERD6-like 12 [Papilio machaon]|uniref:sugar transporter ERD6-like 12 n=1 Tax=Papilio machaon TaxID=76193 RepID=UPI001E6647B4|nr:sugar transporter ERD6-like 12 [Papilio machaon]